MKRYFLILLACALLLLCGCKAEAGYKTSIFNLVEQQQSTLLAYIEAEDYSAPMDLESVEAIYSCEQFVNFYCGGQGIAPSSQDYGFYYSFDGNPMGVLNSEVFCGYEELTEKEEGFYAVVAGNNDYYTEKICDNFYYYEIRW